ncbi:acyltransferase domain-containing protein [Paenibacillus sp. GYB003]|uniref:acyltransferase domain-containing protein n=1 Tax=Paenibacillus sp. GYB003 TaxID=2994392 RepID=UPI002F967ACF
MLGDWLKGLGGSNGVVDFLHPAYMERACAAIRLPDEAARAVVEEAAHISGDERLKAAARRLHRELFVDKAAPGDANKRLLATGPRPAMLAAVVYMGALPQMIDFYEAKGIPEPIWLDTLDDMAIWMRHYYDLHGKWGLGQVGWLVNHMTGRLFRLGRLQFMFKSYGMPFKAFRHRTTGDVAVLSDSGVRFRADGQADGTNGVFDPEGGWTSVYAYDGSAHKGNPISAAGAAEREPVILPEREWEPILQPGDTVLDVHIPEGSKMSHELCRDSYRQAAAFAESRFPEKPFKAFVCTSWLLAPQFPRLLPADSNIVKFQSDYYITPVRSDELQTLERVFGFGTTPADLPRLPRETTLQRIVYDHLASGGYIHGASGFVPKDDAVRT